MNTYATKNIHIVGVSGVEGFEILRFLHTLGVENLTVHDFCEEKLFARSVGLAHPNWNAEERKEAVNFFKNLSIKKHFKNSYLEGIDEAEVIFASQAWYRYPQNIPTLENLLKKGVAIQTTINLYLEFFKGTKIGITGSNGKTTTTHVVNEILKKLIDKKITKGNLFFGGNERSGGQSLTAVINSTKDDTLLLEISNRQLKVFGNSNVDLAAVTNITPNHIGEHGSFENYIEAKTRILQNAVGIIREEDSALIETHCKIKQKKLIKLNHASQILGLKQNDMPLVGSHNFQNMEMAVEIVKEFLNIKTIALNEDVEKTIVHVIKNLKGVPKRLEFVTESNGIKLINDLSSTTAISTEFALNAFPEQSVLVIGGNHKGDDFQHLIEICKKRFENKTLLKTYVLPGTIKDDFFHKLDGDFVSYVDSLEEVSAQIRTLKTPFNLIISPAGEEFISKFLKEKTLEKVFTTN